MGRRATGRDITLTNKQTLYAKSGVSMMGKIWLSIFVAGWKNDIASYTLKIDNREARGYLDKLYEHNLYVTYNEALLAMKQVTPEELQREYKRIYNMYNRDIKL